MSKQHVIDAHDAVALVASVRGSVDSTHFVQTTLKTNDRVIARVTDGIYRQPGSALRELINNAYDADASRVVITTDAPRFSRIVVEDDGRGMSPEVLVHLVGNIGGSAKRTEDGASLGVTSEEDVHISPGGRRLIGKIGIGLFSVSQLTHSFQIITKTKGDGFRTVASIALRQYSDEEGSSARDERGQYESGKVTIWREKATDLDSSGTTIVLDQIRRQARETLRTQEIWSAIAEAEKDEHGGKPIDPPRFHIGRVGESGDVFQVSGGEPQSLPWKPGDEPDKAFRELVSAVWRQTEEGTPNPRLQDLFDYYLMMIWQLALAVPLPYVDGHPFDKPSFGWTRTFLLSNKKKENAIEVSDQTKSIREVAGAVEGAGGASFRVLIDNVELSRPISFSHSPQTKAALNTPIFFVGKCTEEFNGIPVELSGGPLSFEAYLCWAPKVAPVEHRGSLIRIHGASGTLFDPSFLRYQVQETRRLTQITCEIFVHQGLDGALNIDRESFNVAHPHAVYITRWLHEALRQVANTQKRLSGELHNAALDVSTAKAVGNLESIVNKIWHEETDEHSFPPSVELINSNAKEIESAKNDVQSGERYEFSRDAIVIAPARNQTYRARSELEITEQKVKAIAQILVAYGLLDTLPRRKQERLLKSIYEILSSPGA